MRELTAVTGDPPLAATPRRRWLARLSFILAFVAVALVLAVAEWKSFLMFGTGLAGAVVSVTAAFLVLSRRGVVRWVALAAFALAPAAVMVAYAFADLLWVAAISLAAWLLAAVTARAALAEDRAYWRMPEFPAPPARRPFLIMNPRSGGGKVARFDLRRKAEAAGSEVFLMEGPGLVDVAAVARQAVADGADLLGVAGGDGTQALVAGIAAEHGLPFLVIAAGTRNHFALDLGLDRADPAAGLQGLTDGVELHVDLGTINGQTFVNNASFGAYAEVVQTPAYRDDKLGTTLDTLPDLLQGHRGTRFSAAADGARIDAPQALLVASNPYETGDIAGLGRRARLDRGELGVVAVTVSTARQAVGLLRGRRSDGVRVLTARSIVVTSDAPRIPVGVDGEALVLACPVRCTIAAGALRVRVPRDRPGVPPPRAAISLDRLRRLASGPRGPRPHRAAHPPVPPTPNVPPLEGGHRGPAGQVPHAGRLRAAHRASRGPGPRQGTGRGDSRVRRRAAGRLVGHRPAGTRRGHRGGTGRARAGASGAGSGLRDQLSPAALGAAGGPRRPGRLLCLGRETAAHRTVPRAARARRGRRRPAAHRRAARPAARVHLPALGPATAWRTGRAAAAAPPRPAQQAPGLRPRPGPAGWCLRHEVLYGAAAGGRQCRRWRGAARAPSHR
jgi:diacylglycerol kinase family enzyme